MPSLQKTKIVGRAAAILTTSAVASNTVQVGNTSDGNVLVYADFTKGSLTNVIINPQVSDDGTNWYDLTTPGALTLTADGAKAFSCPCGGAKYFRCTATGTGTVTSSSLALKFGYTDRLGT